jgi:hypothetical protein
MAIVDADGASLLKRMGEYEPPKVTKWISAQAT